MQSGGSIIRLIDVVMIILLGFLNISDFGIKAQIKLDSASSQEQPNETLLYYVLVSPVGGFIITNSQNDETILFAQLATDSVAARSAEVAPAENLPEAETGRTNLANLEIFLNNRFEANSQQEINTLVVIKSHPETRIQYAIDVLDICEKNHIPRTLSY